MRALRSKLTYANVISTLCLFLVLGGGAAVAAGQLGPNSVGTQQIKNAAVTGPKIKRASIEATKLTALAISTLKGEKGPKGAKGATGAKGANGREGPKASAAPPGPGAPRAPGHARQPRRLRHGPGQHRRSRLSSGPTPASPPWNADRPRPGSTA